jgi:hypothetical protein
MVRRRVNDVGGFVGQVTRDSMRWATRAIVLIGIVAAWGCAPAREANAPVHPVDPSSRRDAATWEPPEGLEFLRTVPELRGVDVDMPEAAFLGLIKSRPVKVKRDTFPDDVSYTVSTRSGENVIVMFREGTCSGIQRMAPTPPEFMAE